MRFVAATAVVFAGVLVGCAGDDDRVIVFAASSLTDVFAELEDRFEAGHDVDVVVNVGGSSTLATQIEQGAPADVFAAADAVTARRAAPAAPWETFATNSLAIVVESGNPNGVVSLADFARGELVIVVAAPEVPAGRYAAEAFAAAGVDPDVDSFEQSVRSVAAKVALGEADAGVVYVTDAAAFGDAVEVIAIAAADNPIAQYPIAALTDGDAAQDFVRFVLSDEGRAVLIDAGFGVP